MAAACMTYNRMIFPWKVARNREKIYIQEKRIKTAGEREKSEKNKKLLRITAVITMRRRGIWTIILC